MAITDFQTGDRVRLKSGGLTMTVEAPLAEFDRVGCVYFDRNGNMRRSTFHVDTLELVHDPFLQLEEDEEEEWEDDVEEQKPPPQPPAPKP